MGKTPADVLRDTRRIIVSLGGNALIKPGERGAVEEQFRNAGEASRHIASLYTPGKSVLLTHGNGPIVGNIFIRNEAAKELIPPMPLYICGADSEGGIGFMIGQTLRNELLRQDKRAEVATVITQVVVDPSDPAFKNPSKPVGPYYTEEEAEALRRTRNWTVVEDSRRGFRRVVPSPRPVEVVESGVVKRLFLEGVIVIAAGGGGVPVARKDDGTLEGIDAVIDKDLATSLLAKDVGGEVLINLTQIEMVYLDFGKPGAKGLRTLRVKDAKEYLAGGEFAPGSMGPKIEASIEFLEAGGKEVLITTPELLPLALEGKTGTRILP